MDSEKKNTLRPDIATYTDWRLYLGDTVKWLQATDSAFSLRQFSKKTGIKSHTHLTKVINGEIELNDETILQYAKGLDFDFETTVKFRDLCLGSTYEFDFPSNVHAKSVVIDTIVYTLVDSIGKDPKLISEAMCAVVTENEIAESLQRIQSRVGKNVVQLAMSEEDKKEMGRSLLRFGLRMFDNRRIKPQGFGYALWATDEQIKDLHNIFHKEIHKLVRNNGTVNENNSLNFVSMNIGTFLND